jgi:hypothetical protein
MKRVNHGEYHGWKKPKLPITLSVAWCTIGETNGFCQNNQLFQVFKTEIIEKHPIICYLSKSIDASTLKLHAFEPYSG